MNVRVALLRYFNASGADPDGQLSERHDPETHLIPLAIDAASGRGPPLQIFGADYPTSDGTANVISFTYLISRPLTLQRFATLATALKV
jgi:UDP-glucose 4-epimerase